MTKKSFLSSDQSEALNNFISWLDLKVVDTPFLLSGYAGSGKTFLARKFLKIVEERNICWTVAAPTHKAVGVLCKTLEEEGLEPTWYPSTIHRLLRLRLRRRGDQEICEETDQTPKSLDQLGLVLIDEASMLGSNLLEIVFRCAHTFNTRLVFVGDSAQLPPVGEQKSPVFLIQRAVKSHLADVIRHQGPVLKLANLVREDTFPCNQPPCFSIIRTKEGLVGSLDPKNWLDKAKSSLRLAAERKNPDAARILCYTNRYLDRLVPHARRAVHGDLADQMSVLPGEVLISRRAIMTSASVGANDFEEEPGILFGSNTEFVVDDVNSQIFDWPEIDLALQDGVNVSQIQCLIAKVLVGKIEASIRLMPAIGSESRFHLDGLMEWLCNKAKNLPKKEARAFWRKYFFLRDSFAFAGPASVLTVHRSQGSTFQEVFIASDIFFPDELTLRKQLAYVAVSRASKQVWLAGDALIDSAKNIWERKLSSC